MPRSVFLGRVTVPGEPLWTDEDRAYALALLAYDADQCSGCGGSRSEMTAPEAEGAYWTEPIRCYGCQAVEKAAKAGNHEPEGLYFRVIPTSAHRR